MRLRLYDRLRQLARWGEKVGRHRAGGPPAVARLVRPGEAASPQWPAGRNGQPFSQPPALPRSPAVQRPSARVDQRDGARGVPGAGGAGRARIRELTPPGGMADGLAAYGTAPVEPVATAPATRQPWYQVVPAGSARTAPRHLAHGEALPWETPAALRPASPVAARLPLAMPHPAGHPPTADGRRNCGPLEKVLHRQWDEGAALPAQVIVAIDRLAEFPRHLQEKLADNLTGIYVGPGGVPDLDDMSRLHGVPLPSGRATWDACAGAYGERKIVVGSRPSPTPDVICHEVGHALDDLDAPDNRWQSDSPEFRWVYDLCKPHIVSDFHRQRGGLGRKEFFADAFASIASSQRPALVDMLGGNTRTALRVMLYFNRRYGI